MSFKDWLNKKKNQVTNELSTHIIQPTENFVKNDIAKPVTNFVNDDLVKPVTNIYKSATQLPDDFRVGANVVGNNIRNEWNKTKTNNAGTDLVTGVYNPPKVMQASPEWQNKVKNIEGKVDNFVQNKVEPAISKATSWTLGNTPGVSLVKDVPEVKNVLNGVGNVVGGLTVGLTGYKTPQERQDLQTASEAIKSGNYTPEQLKTVNNELVNMGLNYAGMTGNVGEQDIPTSQTNPTTTQNTGSKISKKQLEQPLTENTTQSQQPSETNMAQSVSSGQPEIPVQETGNIVKQPEIRNQQSYNGTIPQNTRSFNETVRNSATTSPELRAKLQDDLYKTRNSKELAMKAKTLVKENPDFARDLVASKNDDVSIAVGSELIKKLQNNPETIDEAVDIANNLAKKLTEAGRTSQAASLYASMTPEGILRFTQKEINKALELRPNLKIGLTSEKAVKIVAMSKKVQAMEEGYAKEVATKKMLKEIYDIIPPTFVKKLTTFQTMAQLLNPKTMIRNVGGNAAFQGLENVSQSVGTPLDIVTSWFTGKRTTTLPSLKTQFKGGVEGLNKATKEAISGINTSGSTQFDLNEIPVFRDAIFGNAEKAMNVALRATDRSAFQAAFDDSIRSSLKLANTDKVTTEMVEQAAQLGWYRTFQDENMVSNFFVSIKKALNTISIKQGNDRFGLGDLILKYPKTPANLIARGLDYSPAGFVKTVFEMGKPLFGREFNQKAFVDSTSRALVGSAGLVGTGVILGKLGIITEAPSKDKDIRGIQKTQGQGSYQINVSALKRFILTGFNKDAAKIRGNDTLVSYDWAQPAAIPLSMGAKIGHGGNAKDSAVSGTDALNEGVSTLAEQPMVKQLQQFASGQQGLMETATNTLKSAPSSFVPTAVNQIGQMTDNTSRQTSDPNALVETKNLVQTKIPIWRKSLPEKVDVLGNTQETYQNGSNNFFNVFLNPAFVNKYKPNATATEVLRLMDATGKTGQMPKVQSNNVTVNGEKITLTPNQVNEMQRYIGVKTQNAIQSLQNNIDYNSLSDDDKAKKITSLLSDIGNAAKIKILGDKPKNVTNSVKSIVSGGYPSINSKISIPSLPKSKRVSTKKIKVKKASVSSLKSPKKFKIKTVKAPKIKGTKLKIKLIKA